MRLSRLWLPSVVLLIVLVSTSDAFSLATVWPQASIPIASPHAGAGLLVQSPRSQNDNEPPAATVPGSIRIFLPWTAHISAISPTPTMPVPGTVYANITLNPGWNFIGLWLTPAHAPLSASAWMQDINAQIADQGGAISQVAVWMDDRITPYSGDIQGRRTYFLYLSGGNTVIWPMNGYRITNFCCFSLTAMTRMAISFASIPTGGRTAADVRDDIDAAAGPNTFVRLWRMVNGGAWEFYDGGDMGVADFPLSANQGYLLEVTRTFMWPPWWHFAPTPTKAPSPVSPTATYPPAPTAAPIATATPAPAVPTAVPAPTATPTRTATPAPAVPTAVPAPTATPTRTATPQDTCEPNNSFDQACPIIADAPVLSYISYIADRDYFRFVVAEPSLAYIALTDLPADFDLYLYNPMRQEIDASFNDGIASEYITRTLSAPGTYYALVQGAGPAFDAVQPYRLMLTFGPPE